MRSLIIVEMRDDQAPVLHGRVAERTVAFTIIAVAVAFGLVALPAPDRNWGEIVLAAVPRRRPDRSRDAMAALASERSADRPDRLPRARPRSCG